jgi:hypothetical protein
MHGARFRPWILPCKEVASAAVLGFEHALALSKSAIELHVLDPLEALPCV